MIKIKSFQGWKFEPLAKIRQRPHSILDLMSKIGDVVLKFANQTEQRTQINPDDRMDPVPGKLVTPHRIDLDDTRGATASGTSDRSTTSRLVRVPQTALAPLMYW
jgi:hypothetical protein